MPADWQLPPGVSRGLWDQLHDPEVARLYDSQLADTPLLTDDIAFVRRHCPVPARLIDLGCGTGRLCLCLARDGYRTLAVDLSPEMLKIVGEKAVQQQVVVDRLRANLVELDAIADGSFDYAACLFSTLGLIAGAENRRRFLCQVRRILRPGGIFVVHVHNRWFHLGTRHGRRLLAGNVWQAIRGRAAFGDMQSGTITMHLFSRREIVRDLDRAGFSIREVLPIGTLGPLRRPWLLPSWRAYGFLVAAAAYSAR